MVRKSTILSNMKKNKQTINDENKRGSSYPAISKVKLFVTISSSFQR